MGGGIPLCTAPPASETRIKVPKGLGHKGKTDFQRAAWPFEAASAFVARSQRL